MLTTISTSVGFPRPQEAEKGQTEEALEPVVQPNETQEAKFGGGQLALALSLSDAKPQPVSASSYGGRRKRSPQEANPQEAGEQKEEGHEQEVDEHAKFGGSQLALALSLSDAKPQPVSASSYGGRRKRSPQEANPQEAGEQKEEGHEQEVDEHAKFGGSQLALALSLSDAKPQPVSASSYGGRRKISPQVPTEESDGTAAEEQPAEQEKNSKSETSQLSLALELSGAKPQPVSASSYGGRRKRSPLAATF